MGKVESGGETVQWGKLFQVREELGVRVILDVPGEVAGQLAAAQQLHARKQRARAARKAKATEQTRLESACCSPSRWHAWADAEPLGPRSAVQPTGNRLEHAVGRRAAVVQRLAEQRPGIGMVGVQRLVDVRRAGDMPLAP